MTSDTPRTGYVTANSALPTAVQPAAPAVQAVAVVAPAAAKKDTKPPEFTRAKGKNTELRFSPAAWAKLIWLRDRGSTEISVFGLSKLADLLYVEDVVLVKQTASGCHFDFDDQALNEYLFDMVKAGYQPVECMRIWIHTHPGGATPSSIDRETFAKTTGEADWGIMCIVGNDGETSARLRATIAGQQYDVTLKVVIDWTGTFKGVSMEDAASWEVEYQSRVIKEVPVVASVPTPLGVDVARSQVAAFHKGGDYGHYDSYGRYDNYDNYSRGYAGYGGWLDDNDKDMPRMQEPVPSAKNADGVANVDSDQAFGTQQMVHLIEDDIASDTTTVWTDKYWFEYDIDEKLLIDVGQAVDYIDDICLTEPLMWGEAHWEIDKGTSVCSRDTFFDPDTDSFIAYADETAPPAEQAKGAAVAKQQTEPSGS